MKQLNVTLIHKENDTYRHLTGWWSYPVPEFTWQSIKVPQNFSVKPNVTGTDLIVLDDWIFGYVDRGGHKMAYVTVDSARSDEQLRRNLVQAMQADLLLIDSDRLEKFYPAGKPVKRFAYAVNEHLFKPRDKEYDVAFLCWPTPERRKVQSELERICKDNNWRFVTGTYNWQDYAKMIGLAKIVVHSPHVKQARSWRFFDVMASKGCILTEPIPLVSGDGIVPGVHYAEYNGIGDIESRLFDLLENDTWFEYAEAGYFQVIKEHTWNVRAEQLRKIIAEELGL